MTMDTDTKKHTAGFRSVLVTEECFERLKQLQKSKSCGDRPVWIDLKDLASTVIEEALAIPGFTDRVLVQALVKVQRNIALVLETQRSSHHERPLP
jgi:hypothetical protein